MNNIYALFQIVLMKQRTSCLSSLSLLRIYCSEMYMMKTYVLLQQKLQGFRIGYKDNAMLVSFEFFRFHTSIDELSLDACVALS